jgi:hypothetical protein
VKNIAELSAYCNSFLWLFINSITAVTDFINNMQGAKRQIQSRTSKYVDKRCAPAKRMKNLALLSNSLPFQPRAI